MTDESRTGLILPDGTHYQPRKASRQSVVEQSAPQGIDLGAMMRLATEKGDEGLDALDRIIAMVERQEAKEARNAYHASMLRVQAETPRVLKRGKNKETRSSFAKLEDVDRIAREIYTRHGFEVTFGTREMHSNPGWIMHVASVAHRGGHIEELTLPLPIDSKGPKGGAVKTEMHGVGSALTYAQRRLTCMAFNLVAENEDIDGNPPPDTRTITEHQAADLRALADEVFSTFDGFLRHFRTDSFAGIKMTDYHTALSRLEARRRYIADHPEAAEKLAASKAKALADRAS